MKRTLTFFLLRTSVVAAFFLSLCNGLGHAQQGVGGGTGAGNGRGNRAGVDSKKSDSINTDERLEVMISEITTMFDGNQTAENSKRPLSLSLFSGMDKTAPGIHRSRFSPSRFILPLIQIDPEVEIRNKYRQNLLFELTQRIVGDGCSKQARDEAAWIILEMMKSAPISILKNMVDFRVTPIIVPAGKHILDMPQAIGLKKTNWDEGKYVGVTTQTSDGLRLVFVREEDLLGRKNHAQGNRSRNIFVHEWAHAVQDWGMKFWAGTTLFTSYDGLKITNIYYEAWDKIRAQHDIKEFVAQFPDGYSATNRKEFFAQLTTLWFNIHEPLPELGGKNYLDEYWTMDDNLGSQLRTALAKNTIKPLDANWIRENKQELYDTLKRIYGSPRVIKPLPDDKF